MYTQHSKIDFVAASTIAPLVCRCNSHGKDSFLKVLRSLNVVFVSDHFSFAGSALLRHSQAVVRMRQVGDLGVEECSIYSSKFDEIENSIIVLGKWALRKEMIKRIDKAATRNNILIADYVDGVHNPWIDEKVDGFLCSSFTEFCEMNERQRLAWLVPHAIDDRWFGFLGPRNIIQLNFVCGYHGTFENCLFPIELQKYEDLVLHTDLNCYRINPWRDDLLHWANSVNVHFLSRPSGEILKNSFKPFIKGFLAANLGAIVIGSRFDHEHTYWLGEDYPYMVEGESLDQARDAIQKCRQDFGQNSSLKAKDAMIRLRRQSCPVQNASDYLSAFQGAAALKWGGVESCG